jgi:hypothetical protein
MSLMYWRKLGKVFDPSQHVLPFGCKDFTQAPQALVLEDRIRVYFSTREREEKTGKYLSHVAYADFDHDFRVQGVSAHTVIGLGKKGTFDEHGIFPMNVVKHNDLVYGYTSGVNRRVSVPVDGAIGLAVSRDAGHTFERMGDGPVLAPSLREPCIVVDPFVQVFDGVFHMWYVFGRGWNQPTTSVEPDRVYKIGHATSPDGIRWKKEEARAIVGNRLGVDECQAMPTVIRLGDGYHMFFCYRHASDFRRNRDRSYRIGHAWSTDLSNWTRDDAALGIDATPGEWDSDMLCYPHAFQHGGKVYLLYNGNEFGRYGFGLAVLEP